MRKYYCHQVQPCRLFWLLSGFDWRELYISHFNEHLNSTIYLQTWGNYIINFDIIMIQICHPSLFRFCVLKYVWCYGLFYKLKIYSSLKLYQAVPSLIQKMFIDAVLNRHLCTDRKGIFSFFTSIYLLSIFLSITIYLSIHLSIYLFLLRSFSYISESQIDCSSDLWIVPLVLRICWIF